MKLHTVVRSLTCIAFVAIAVAVNAQMAAGRPLEDSDRVALIIGNGDYRSSPLGNPTNDAADMAAALRGLGFNVTLRRNANTREMRQAIREFGTSLRRAKVGLFYFAGHGVQMKGNNYLIPVGVDFESEADVEDLAIDANYTLRTMEESQVEVSIVVLDACRNNPFARSMRSASRGLAQMTAATGTVIAFATAPGSTAADGSGRNGTYTKHLLASLKQDDSDILKVFQRTRAGVVRETAGKQTPWESTSLIGDFHFRSQIGAVVAAVRPDTPSQTTEVEDALRPIRTAAEAGDADAMARLAQAYSFGIEVPKDEARALALYRRAAEKGHVDATYRVGTFLRYGLGTPADPSAAVGYILKAARLGSRGAMADVAQMYATGSGLPMDSDVADKWLRAASGLGPPPR